MAYEAKVKAELKYSKTHEWVEVNGDEATIGISDYAQHHLGSIVFVDLPAVDNSYEQFKEFGAVESVKAASDLYIPVSGTVIEVNEALEDQPELVNEDCYANFIIKVKVANVKDLDGLMSADEYKEFCANQK